MRFRRKPKLARDVRRLQLQPGDVVLVTYADRLACEQAMRIKRVVEDAVPGHRCLVVAGGLDVSALGPEPLSDAEIAEMAEAWLERHGEPA